jgi:hypothetical protein
VGTTFAGSAGFERHRRVVVVGGAVIIAAVAWVISSEARARRRTLPGRDAGACPIEPT